MSLTGQPDSSEERLGYLFVTLSAGNTGSPLVLGRPRRRASMRPASPDLSTSPIPHISLRRHLPFAANLASMAARVLIVEDDPAQRRILEEMVKRFGFEP